MCLNLRQPAMIAALLLSSIAPVARAAADVPPAATAPTAPTVRAPAPPATAAAPPARPAEAPAQVPAFGFANVRQLAQQRAAHEYHPVSDALPASIANLSYDQYRDIRFRPASALWRGEALFEVQFFHRGYSNKEHINIFEVGPAGVTPVAYDPRFFTFGRLLKIPRAPASLGYAGFRVHYPLQTPHYKDELVAFLGASYFRVLARNESYGASARGLAIDTAEPGSEEFPTFTDFWLVRPQPNERTLTVYALLDSKSVAGAYQFEIRPGRDHAGRGALRAVRAPRDRQARRGAAHLHVPVQRRDGAADASMTTARRFTTATVSWPRPATGSGCGGRSAIRASCASTAS